MRLLLVTLALLLHSVVAAPSTRSFPRRPALGDLVNLGRYPIGDLRSAEGRALVEKARRDLQASGCASFPCFLTAAALSDAVAEAKKLGIPVIAVVDTNTDPEDITYPVPGNDDALRAIHLYCDLFSAAVLDGIQAEMGGVGDLGELEDPMAEPLPGTELSEGEPAAVESSESTTAPAGE